MDYNTKKIFASKSKKAICLLLFCVAFICSVLPVDFAWASDFNCGVSYDDFMEKEVVAGGQSVGILLQTEGASVVGYSPVEDENGKDSYPAKSNGVKVGDFITSVNDQKVDTDEEIAKIIDSCGEKNQDVKLSVNRDGKDMVISTNPVYNEESGNYKIGLVIRDNTAGVGTMTFYEPESKVFGALGHKIDYLSDKEVKSEKKGTLVSADIQEIKKGLAGSPGEKIGFFNENGIKGNIKANNYLGVFGVSDSKICNSVYPKKMKIAKVQDVKKGPAKMLTVVEGNKIEEYDVKIEKTMPLAEDNGQGMVIKITDENLLKKTGGIVQGMSGSPIIQNNKLVGAVTHVFVNDPTSGYGCYAEWMVRKISG